MNSVNFWSILLFVLCYVYIKWFKAFCIKIRTCLKVRYSLLSLEIIFNKEKTFSKVKKKAKCPWYRKNAKWLREVIIVCKFLVVTDILSLSRWIWLLKVACLWTFLVSPHKSTFWTIRITQAQSDDSFGVRKASLRLSLLSLWCIFSLASLLLSLGVGGVKCLLRLRLGPLHLPGEAWGDIKTRLPAEAWKPGWIPPRFQALSLL